MLLTLLLEVGGLLFFDFIPRDIGRASADFILSVGWLTGCLFLFFHAVQVMAWDEERRTIHTILARPISRPQYVLGVFLGLAMLLFLLNCILAILGYVILALIKGSVKPIFFHHLSTGHFLLSWLGLYCIELTILSVIMLFSGLIRGGFPVLLLSISYYFICTGLPVVRDSLMALAGEGEISRSLSTILRWLTALFPDFNRFDFKALITSEQGKPFIQYFSTDIVLMITYMTVILWCASIVYQRRDLQ
ncbi:MAG: ABC transporter permease subunit [Desulforhopalus sp.]|nr:ABC transporter permease subunit [Desulforhopalus sp.]